MQNVNSKKTYFPVKDIYSKDSIFKVSNKVRLIFFMVKKFVL